MAEQVRVVVDAMGGDNAPAEPVRAAVEAVTERQDIKVILTGKQEEIRNWRNILDIRRTRSRLSMHPR